LSCLDNVTFNFIGDAATQIADFKAGDIDVIGFRLKMVVEDHSVACWYNHGKEGKK
jgi:ABC-type transport system substrate-binding protein